MLKRLKSTKFATWYNEYHFAIVTAESVILTALFTIMVIVIMIKSVFLSTIIAIAFSIIAILKLFEICFSNDNSRKTTIYNYVLFVLYILCTIIFLI